MKITGKKQLALGTLLGILFGPKVAEIVLQLIASLSP